MKSQLLSLIILFLPCLLWSQSNDEKKSVQLQAVVSESPLQITLHWDNAVEASGDVSIYRRAAGTSSWGAILATVSSGTLSYTDETVEAGTAYEYRVTRPGAGSVGHGYLYSSTALAAPEKRGTLLMVIDDETFPEVANELERYWADVEADGWRVRTLLIAADSSAASVKEDIVALYQQNPGERHALFLVGRVPVPYSGNIYPDGHTNHIGAWPADVYYADVDGSWTDSSVENTSASSTRNHNIPGDGKWDQSYLPSDVEMEVGRVDFNRLPHFSEDAFELTRRYFDKNHAFRRKHFEVPQRGLIENNFASFAEGFGQNGLKNFSTLVGRDSTYYRDYDELKTAPYLFSYGCGGGNYQGASGISNTSTMASDSFQTVFTFLFGSYFGDWDAQNNFLRAALGSGTILANAWAGRPNWALHPMAMGETIGYCTKLTQNNAGFSYDAGFGNRSVHVALMGDPTLRMHMMSSPPVLTVSENQEGVELSWLASAEADVSGYHIYRRQAGSDFYERITTAPITTLSFLDPCPQRGDSLQYLVKALRLETSPSGRFYNESPGTFAGIRPQLDRTVVAAFDFELDNSEVSFSNLSENATAYSWSFGDGSTSTDPNPTHNFADGVWSVQLIAENACSTDTITQLVEVISVGVRDIAELGLEVWPNPVPDGQLQCKGPTASGEIHLRLIDALGRIRLQTIISGPMPRSIDVRGLENGLYLLEGRKDGQRATRKLLLNRW